LPQQRGRDQRRALLHDIEQLRALTAAGATITEIAERARVTTAEVRTIFSAHSITGSDRRRHVDADRVRQLAIDGRAFRHIAAELGTSTQTVRSITRAHGIQSRHVQYHASELRDHAWLRHEYIERDRSMADIGRQLGVAHQTVRAALDRMSIPTRPPRRVDDDRIRQLIEAGHTITEVAGLIGVSSETVRRYAILLGLHSWWTPRSPRELRDPQWLQSNYLSAGREISEVANELHVTDETVRKALRRAGIPIRRRRHKPPPKPDALRRKLEQLRTISAVARSYGVGEATAERWFAEIGVFRHSRPRITKRDMKRALREHTTIAATAAALGVSDHTVVIERIRHAL